MKARYLLATVFLALAVLFLFNISTGAASLTDSQDFVSVDSESYLSSAKMMHANATPHSKRPVTYAAVLASGLFVGVSLDELIWYSYGLNILFWVGTAVLVFLTIRLYSSNSFALIGALIFSLCIGSLANLNSALSESLTTLLYAAAAYAFLSNELKGRLITGATLATALLLFSSTIRPGAFYLAIVALIALLALALLRKEMASVRSMTLLALSLVILFMNMSMMRSQYDHFTVSMIDKYTWYPYIGAQVEADLTGNTLKEVKEQRHLELREWGPSHDLTGAASADMKDKISGHFGLVVSIALKNVWNNLTSESSPMRDILLQNNGGFWHLLLLKASMYQNLILSLFGVIVTGLLMLRKRQLGFWFILLVIGYTIVTSGVSFWQGDRFHLVFYPLSVMVIMIFLSESKLIRRWFPSLAPEHP